MRMRTTLVVRMRRTCGSIKLRKYLGQRLLLIAEYFAEAKSEDVKFMVDFCAVATLVSLFLQVSASKYGEHTCICVQLTI